MALFRRRHEVDMTEGAIAPLIISFAIPLLLGNFFQQLYNMVDTWVVGNFVGKNAFSAVGTLSSTTNAVIGFFMGFSSGAGVVISQHYGAKQNDKASEAVHTFVLSTLIACVAITILGLCSTPLFLKVLNAPPEVMAEQRVYLTVYFAGVSGLLIYNMGSSILRAIGDSRHPFEFLLVSSFTNIVLDLVLVIAFGWGTFGVAIATVISQAASAFCVLFLLFRTKTCARIEIRKLKINATHLKNILSVGLPTAFQMAITAFSNVFVQSYINYFGADVMGGWTAYNKLDQMLMLPLQSLSIAAMTFVGQNLGNDNPDRARKGGLVTLLISIICTLCLAIPLAVFAPLTVNFFIDSKETGVIEWGTTIIRRLVPLHVVSSFNQIFSGALKGAGKSKFQMACMLFSFVFFRQIYMFIMSRFISNTVVPIVLAYPAGWLVCSVLISLSYYNVFYRHTPKAII